MLHRDMAQNIPPPLPYSITQLWDHEFSEAVTRKFNLLKQHLGNDDAKVEEGRPLPSEQGRDA